jgi:hypothetical protein
MEDFVSSKQSRRSRTTSGTSEDLEENVSRIAELDSRSFLVFTWVRFRRLQRIKYLLFFKDFQTQIISDSRWAVCIFRAPAATFR